MPPFGGNEYILRAEADPSCSNVWLLVHTNEYTRESGGHGRKILVLSPTGRLESLFEAPDIRFTLRSGGNTVVETDNICLDRKGNLVVVYLSETPSGRVAVYKPGLEATR